MKSKRVTTDKESPAQPGTGQLFDRDNMIWMLIGAAVIIVGFLLMAGGRSSDPNVFDTSKVYSATRITVAPILLLAGLIIEIVAIFRQPKA